MKFKKYIQRSMVGPLVFSIILLILGGAVWSKNIYAGIMYLVVGLTQLISNILLYSQIRKREDETEIGGISVQLNWLILSIGVTGCLLFLAPFFTVNTIWIPYTAFTACLISALWCAFNLYKAVKETKVPLAT